MPLLLALLVALVLTFPPPAAADTTLTELARPTPVSAHDGTLVFSRYVGSTRRYELVARDETGRLARVDGIEPSRTAFDADLGPGPDGGLVAVYSRCRRAREACDLHLYDFDRGRERRLGGVSTAGASEYLPSVWRGRVAFVRRAGRRPPELHVASLTGAAPQRVPGGPLGDGGLAGPTGIDLYGRRVAFTWESVVGEDYVTAELRLATLGGPSRRLDRITSGALSIAEYFGPTFDRGRLYATKVRRLESGNRFVRYRLATGRLEQVVGRSNVLSSTADAGRFFYVRTGFAEGGRCANADGDRAPCELRVTGRLPF